MYTGMPLYLFVYFLDGTGSHKTYNRVNPYLSHPKTRKFMLWSGFLNNFCIIEFPLSRYLYRVVSVIIIFSVIEYAEWKRKRIFHFVLLGFFSRSISLSFFLSFFHFYSCVTLCYSVCDNFECNANGMQHSKWVWIMASIPKWESSFFCSLSLSLSLSFPPFGYSLSINVLSQRLPFPEQ